MKGLLETLKLYLLFLPAFCNWKHGPVLLPFVSLPLGFQCLQQKTPIAASSIMISLCSFALTQAGKKNKKLGHQSVSSITSVNLRCRKLLYCVFYHLKCTKISQHCSSILPRKSGAIYKVKETANIYTKLIITLGSSGTCCFWGALTHVLCPCRFLFFTAKLYIKIRKKTKMG